MGHCLCRRPRVKCMRPGRRPRPLRADIARHCRSSATVRSGVRPRAGSSAGRPIAWCHLFDILSPKSDQVKRQVFRHSSVVGSPPRLQHSPINFGGCHPLIHPDGACTPPRKALGPLRFMGIGRAELGPQSSEDPRKLECSVEASFWSPTILQEQHAA
jgi:hypothetical protein